MLTLPGLPTNRHKKSPAQLPAAGPWRLLQFQLQLNCNFNLLQPQLLLQLHCNIKRGSLCFIPSHFLAAASIASPDSILPIAGIVSIGLKYNP
jgi:hypothetical protein